ncbi:GNAT family N-acetyltransferase, partial [Vibrio genomosp. F10 str. 9ZC157]
LPLSRALVAIEFEVRMNIDFSVSPSEEEISEIYNGLSVFNEPHFPDLDENTVGYFVRNEDGKILGGLIGNLLFTTLHVNYLWLSKPLRGSGYGTKLLQLAELEAKNRGVMNVFLDTYTFQAPKFYEQHGYSEVGRYTDYPRQGVDKVFYQKCLARN